MYSVASSKFFLIPIFKFIYCFFSNLAVFIEIFVASKMRIKNNGHFEINPLYFFTRFFRIPFKYTSNHTRTYRSA